MVIVAILGALAIPSYLASARREQLTATSRSVVNWLEDARNEAVKEMVSCEVALTLNSNQTGLLEIKNSSPGCTQQRPLVIGGKDPETTKIEVDGQQQACGCCFPHRHYLKHSRVEAEPTERCWSPLHPHQLALGIDSFGQAQRKSM